MTRIRANGLSFNVAVEGEGAPVLLLHGFPDSAHLWRHQVPALVDAGFRTVTLDLHGLGDSDRPTDPARYSLPSAADDVVAILDALEITSVDLVGHDWGAGLAWVLAMTQAERVRRLVALSVGHPGGFFADAVAQRERSWYMLFFLHPGVAEAALKRDDWRLFRLLLRDRGDMSRYVTDLARPGALSAALNWYRANVTPEWYGRGELPVRMPVTCPVMGVWSTEDHHLTEAQMTASERFVSAPWRYERIEGASHWMQLDAPDRLNELLLEFLGAT